MVWDSYASSNYMIFAALHPDASTSFFFEFNDTDERGFYLLAVANGLSVAQASSPFRARLFRSNGATFDNGDLWGAAESNHGLLR
jgi:hypothetical protein